MALFQKDVQNSIHCVVCPDHLDERAAEEFTRQSKAWMMTPVDIYIFDFSSTQKIGRAFYPAFLQLKRTLQSNEKVIFSLGLSTALKEQLYAAGLLGAFAPVRSVTEAEEKAQGPRPDSKPAPQKMDVNLLAAFVSGAKKAFEVQCNTPIELKNPHIKKESLASMALGSLVTLVSPKFRGTVALLFPKEVFLKIYGNLFDEEPKEITSDMEDAAAEVLNIVYGQAKTELNEKGYDLPRAFPQVLTGEQIQRQATRLEKTMVLPLTCTAGMFYIEIESE